ncbi:SDR family NAD(P)-dependent oxidoreductase [Spirillospora sp. NBC_00431]
MTATNSGLGDTEEQLRGYLKRTAAELLKARRKVAELERREPLAIIGMACRLPGGAHSPEALWELLASGGDAVGDFPDDRGWDLSALHDTDPDKEGKSSVVKGGFVRDAGWFDAGFFGISPHEALAMDPQQRLLLEATWEACEDARIDPSTLRGSRTGVFVGVSPGGYNDILKDVPDGVSSHLSLGSATSVHSGRVAYAFGLEGPAVAVDTACSSSLVALHLAARSLHGGECSTAIVGGVTIATEPNVFTDLSRQRGLAADGRCKAFGATADGTGMSEGVGVLVMERLPDAVASGRRILAVVRGSAVNQDGASNGLTAPNGPSQERVIRDALADARLAPHEVDAVEGHGTGTTLGDPIEAHALLATYGRDRSAHRPLWLGSIKSNIGHTQAAAGVAAVIKMVLALRHEELPKTLHADEPSPHVDWASGGVSLLTERRPWPRREQPRRAGVSSFGISGTNAHVVIEEAPPTADAPSRPSPERGPFPIMLSARSAEGLRGQAARLAGHLRERPDTDPLDLAFSLAATRASLEHRAVVVAATGREIQRDCESLAAGSAVNAVTGVADLEEQPVWVFPGQGSQWPGMGVELMATCPVFAEHMNACQTALAPHVPWTLHDVLHNGDLEPVDTIQPVLWAIMVSLARTWQSFGITPAAVIGHSQGEIAAAHIAGALTLDDAAKVVALRSQALRTIAGTGAMASIPQPAGQVTELIRPWNRRLNIAAINGPTTTVVSGDTQAIEELLALPRDHQPHPKRIPVDYASHSPHIDAITQHITTTLQDITPQPATIPFISSVTGQPTPGDELDAQYWANNLRHPVHFTNAITTALNNGTRTFIETSPHPTLTTGIEQTAEHADLAVAAIGTLRRDNGGMEQMLTSIARAWVRGQPVDWSGVFDGTGALAVDLPAYAFQRHRYWLEGGCGSVAGDWASGAGIRGTHHPLLGGAVRLAGGDEFVLTAKLSRHTHSWLADHAVLGQILLPGTAFVEMALRAGQEVGSDRVEELTLQRPLILPEHGSVFVQLRIGPADEGGRRSLAMYSSRGGAVGETWTLHAGGVLAARTAASVPSGLETWPPPGAERLAIDRFYAEAAEAGYGYGPAFQGLRSVWHRDREVYAEVVLPDEHHLLASRFGIHPALLDAALQATGYGGFFPDDGQVRLPFAWTDVSLHSAGAAALRVRISAPGPDPGTLSVLVTDLSGRPVASAGSVTLRSASHGSLRAAGDEIDTLYRLAWTRMPADAERPARPGRWAVLGDGDLGLAGAGAGVEVAPAAEADEPAPDVVVAAFTGGAKPLIDALDLVREWSADERYGADARLVVVTRSAVAAEAGEDVPNLTCAPIWGLMRSAQAEDPGRLVVVDVDDLDSSGPAIAAVVASGEPQAAVRDGIVLVPRLARAAADGALALPAEDGWELTTAGGNTLTGLALSPVPDRGEPLGEGQIRVAMRAGGLNFRDVLIALGMYPGGGRIGTEGAGVVTEVGPGVREPVVGDRVMGLVQGAFADEAVTDHRLVAPIPDDWSFAAAASIPVAFLTAWYGLVELGGLTRGRRVLIHAAAGGVGMAAVRIARHLGAEVFATASEGKWDALRRLGLDDDHIASSRSLEFGAKFAAGTDGAGMDIVLNSLTGEFIDTSLRLLPRGGRFLEMGAVEVRDPTDVAAAHPGVEYRRFDLMEAGADGMGRMLARLAGLLRDGTLAPPPLRTWDVRRAGEAFRHMSQARHIGKIVLDIPRRPWADAGTVLITGGTGTLGALVARHLAGHHGVPHLLLCSRQGAEAAGADRLRDELGELGSRVTIAACDVADRAQLAALVAGISPEHPLTGVIHAAGVLDDGTLGSLTPERLERVLRPKLDAAQHLHELTRDLDLSAFILFSSAAGTIGSPGQANYAAANTYLDALAAHRHANGLPAQSLAWGQWEPDSALTGRLSETGRTQLTTGGMIPLTVDDALAAFDAVGTIDEAALVPIRLDLTAVSAQPLTSRLRALCRGLVRDPVRRADHAGTAGATTGPSTARRLSGLPEREAKRQLIDLVSAHAAVVLGHPPGTRLDPGRSFRDAGLDSLAAIEVRNRLAAELGRRLPATLTFDHPTPAALARHLWAEIGGAENGAPPVEMRPVDARPGDGRPGDTEPIAIVGMACRYPGGIGSPQALWDVVASGADAITGFPTDRGWDLETLHGPEPGRQGTSITREGGFLADVAMFDAGFFGISPREALAMDPQQRLLLETSWEAFEQAGIAADTLRGSRTGIFIGAVPSGYGASVRELPKDVVGYMSTGNTTSVASGRIAYTFGLEGPAVTVDTACSSSLVALHLAVRSLRTGECSMALVGGAAVMPTPIAFIEFSQLGGLAADGRCKSFSALADGAGWSEGVGMLLVQPLSDALREGRRVLAVVRGSAINQDGMSSGLTAPNGPAQQRVIRAALADAGLSPGEVDAVEAHGTGTRLGDPIEAQALLATYGADRPAERPLWLGSVKSNIGHPAAAAGAAGVIKMVMALRHGVLPRTLHADEPTAHVDWSGPLRLLTEQRPWPEAGRPRRAGVSSFGISGTNAHLILEEAPGTGPETDRIEAAGPLPLVLSGRSAGGLRAQAARIGALAADRPELSPDELGASLVRTRAQLDRRAVVVAEDRAEAMAGLAAVAGGGDPAPDVLVGKVGVDTRTGVVFGGQGSQRVGMGRELYASFGVFRSALDEVRGLFDDALDRPLRQVMWDGPDQELNQTLYAQCGLFALETALYRLTESLGLVPDVVAGHSIGEITAAHIAGVLSLPDAVTLVAARGRLMQALPPGGAMAAVQADEAEVTALLTNLDGAAVAAVNGPDSVVVSGPEEAVAHVTDHFAELGRRTRRLRVSHAFHSPLMEPMLADFATAIQHLTFRPPEFPVISNLTGRPATPHELVTPEYWVQHVRRPVRFADTITTMTGQGTTALLELGAGGPGGALTALIQESAGPEAVAVPALRHDRPEPRALLAALARLWVAGAPVDWSPLFPARRSYVDLPTYAFQRERYWLDTDLNVTGPGPEPLSDRDATDARFWAAVEATDSAALADLGATELEPTLPALAAWRRRRRRESELASWCYRVGWKPRTVPPRRALPGRWILALPADRLDDPWADAIRGALGEPIVLPVDGTADRAELTARIAEMAAGGSPGGVLSLLGADERAHPQHPGATMGLITTLALLQSWADSGVETPLWCATRGAVAAGESGAPVNPAQAQVWGLGRVAAMEHSRHWGGLVDLPATVDQRTAGLLRAVLSGDSGEDEVALRPSGLLTRRLVRARLPEPAADTASRLRGTVLVVGADPRATRIARWLAENGAAHVALAGALDTNGVRPDDPLMALPCALDDRDSLDLALREIEAETGRLVDAVVHATGSPEPEPLSELSAARLAEVLRANVVPAALLDELLRERAPEAFVLCSSVAGLWGGVRHGAHAAADAHLDALAARCRGRGLPATAVAWGPWDTPAEPGRQGWAALSALDPEGALTALRRAVCHDETSVAVVSVDWEQFVPLLASVRPSRLFEDIPEARRALEAGPVTDTGDQTSAELRARLERLTGVERDAALTELVRSRLAAVLGHSRADEVDADVTFKDMGFDSLTAVELRNQLITATGLRLPATLVYDHPTPSALAGHLRDSLLPDEADPVASVEAQLSRIETALVALATDQGAHGEITRRLQAVTARWQEAIGDGPGDGPGSARHGDGSESAAARLRSASDEEILSFIHRELGGPAGPPRIGQDGPTGDEGAASGR